MNECLLFVGRLWHASQAPAVLKYGGALPKPYQTVLGVAQRPWITGWHPLPCYRISSRVIVSSWENRLRLDYELWGLICESQRGMKCERNFQFLRLLGNRVANR